MQATITATIGDHEFGGDYGDHADIGIRFTCKAGAVTTEFGMYMDMFGEEAFLQLIRCAYHGATDDVIGSDWSGNSSDCRPQFRVEGDVLTVGIADPHANDCVITRFGLGAGGGASFREQLVDVIEDLKKQAAKMDESEKLLAAISKYNSLEVADAALKKVLQATGRAFPDDTDSD